MPTGAGFTLEDLIAANLLIAAHLLGAFLAGSVLGYERAYKGHAAGMRTYAIVCMGATALTIAFAATSFMPGGGGNDTSFAAVSRVVQGIVTGVGFLGAGVILRQGLTLRGLSTAASIWMTAAIGVLIGIGFYLAAAIAVLLVVVVLEAFGRLEHRLPYLKQIRAIVSFPPGSGSRLDDISRAARAKGFDLQSWTYQFDDAAQEERYDLLVQSQGRNDQRLLVGALMALDQVRKLSVEPVRD